MGHEEMSKRTFDAASQAQFAAASGDANPMHLDPVAARRTQAGAPVVHGVHLLLWALDGFAKAGEAAIPQLRRLRVHFDRFAHVGATVSAALGQPTPKGARITLSVGGVKITRITLEFGPPVAEAARLGDRSDTQPVRATSIDLDFEQMGGCSGRLAFATPVPVLAAMFPFAAAWLGVRRVASLAAMTNLVGMFCPGLHSIFGGLTLDACTDDTTDAVLAYRVTETEPRFRLVSVAVDGGGFVGSLTTFARMPPTPQPSMKSLQQLIAPTEFAGSVALIIGGSRGLGELTAKMVAAGGGHVIVTHRVGRGDAEAVVSEINAGGGVSQALAYDVRAPAAGQLASLGVVPTHLYYFATPFIYRAQSVAFDGARLNEFLEYYVDGFWRTCEALLSGCSALSIFYPSSVFVDDRPDGMTEYAMAKAAGEILCADMNQKLSPLHVTVRRLPRLPTDQTASIQELETASPLETMLPVVREVQSYRSPSSPKET